MYRFTPFTYLLHEKPDLARERLLDAMVEADGDIIKAQARVDLSSFSWYRYLRILGIKETMINLREQLKAQSAKSRRRHQGALKEQADLLINAPALEYIPDASVLR